MVYYAHSVQSYQHACISWLLSKCKGILTYFNQWEGILKGMESNNSIRFLKESISLHLSLISIQGVAAGLPRSIRGQFSTPGAEGCLRPQKHEMLNFPHRHVQPDNRWYRVAVNSNSYPSRAKSAQIFTIFFETA